MTCISSRENGLLTFGSGFRLLILASLIKQHTAATIHSTYSSLADMTDTNFAKTNKPNVQLLCISELTGSPIEMT